MKKIQYDEDFMLKKNHSFLKIFLFLLFIGILIGGGYYYYQNYYNNPNVIVRSIFQNIQEKNATKPKNDKKILYNGLLNFRLKLDSRHLLSPFENIINNITIQSSGKLDLDNQKNDITISTKYQNKELVNIDVYNEKEDYYFLLNGLYDKYISINQNTLNIDDNELDEIINDIFSLLQLDVAKKLQREDIYIIKNSLISAISNTLNNYSLQRENETIIINNQSQDVVNNYLILNNQEVNNFIVDILNQLSMNNDFMKVIDNFSNNNATLTLNRIKDNLKNSESKASFKTSFYTKKSFKQELISIRQEIVMDNEKIIISYDIIDKNNSILTLSNSKSAIICTLYHNEKAINITVDFNTLYEKFSAILQLNYEEISNIPTKNITNQILYSDLKDQDLETISNNISNNENLSILISDLQKALVEMQEKKQGT